MKKSTYAILGSPINRVATCKSGKSQGENFFYDKVRESLEKLSKSGENEIVLAHVFKKVDIPHFISIFCQRMRMIGATFCYTADKLESGKKILSQGKVREN